MVTVSDLYPSGSGGGGWSVTSGLFCFFSSANSRASKDSSDRISVLEDMSANFNSAVQLTDAQKPTLTGGLISGDTGALDAKFSILQDKLIGTEFSFFFKMKSATNATTIALAYPLFAIRQASTAHWFLGGVARNGSNNIYGYAGINTLTLLQENALPSIANSTEYVLSYLKSSTEWNIYRDGALAATIGDSSTPTSGMPIAPALFTDPSSDNNLLFYSRNGQAFSYLAVYNRLVTNSERIQIESDINTGKYI
jgi:hypothetical protein